MSHLILTDLSDNNPVQSDFTGLDGVILKLYPTSNARGWGWLVQQHMKAVAWWGTHPDFVIGFYAADSTPTWLTAKVAADALGVDLNEHPFAFDLREFGYSRSHVAGEIDAAHKAGQAKVGEYYREADTGDWHWKARYLSDAPAEPWLLWQYTSSPLDHSKTHDGVTRDEFLAATTAIASPPPPGGNDVGKIDDQDQLDQLKQASDAGYIAQQEAKHHGIDITPGKPWRDQLAKIRAGADRKALGALPNKATPIPTDVP